MKFDFDFERPAVLPRLFGFAWHIVQMAEETPSVNLDSDDFKNFSHKLHL